MLSFSVATCEKHVPSTMRVGLEVIPSIVLDALSKCVFFCLFVVVVFLFCFFFKIRLTAIALAHEPILFLTLYMLGNFSCFCYRLLTFFKITFHKKKSFRNTIRESNDLDPDQDLIWVQTVYTE